MNAPCDARRTQRQPVTEGPIQVIGGVASWSEIKNVGGAPGAPGLRLSLQSAGFCRYNYEIWGNSSLGSPHYQRSEFFRTTRPWD